MDEKPKLVIWGASGHASVVADVVRSQGDYEIAGFLDDSDPTRKDTLFCGAPILGTHRELDRIYNDGVRYLIPAFGNCEARIRVSDLARERGFEIATAIHPSATVASEVEIGSGSVVVAGAVINPYSEIGSNVIVNTCASVDHHCVLEDGVHVAPGTHLAGGVHVGRATWVGIGATVIDGVHIGSGSVVGAGAVVLRDVPEGVVVCGVPARETRKVTQ